MCGRIRETLSVLNVGNSRDSSEMAAAKLPAELSTADSESEMLRAAAPKFWASKIVNSEHFPALTISTNQFGTNLMEGKFFPIWNHCATFAVQDEDLDHVSALQRTTPAKKRYGGAGA